MLISYDSKVPFWYELSWENPEIIIKIHKEVREEVFSAINTNRESYDFESIDCNDFIKLAVPSPRNYEEHKSVSTNLGFLFSSLSIVEKETSSKKQQLLTVNEYGISPVGKPYFKGVIGLALRSVIPYIDEDGIHYIENAMKTMYQKTKDGVFQRFSVNTNDKGKFTATCPGNACDIGPQKPSIGDGGYFLLPHNLDRPRQQITLLASLAALHDVARKIIENEKR